MSCSTPKAARASDYPEGKEGPSLLCPIRDVTETPQKAGPTILTSVIPSLADFSPDYSVHARRVVWTGHLVCGFDWSKAEKYRPDEVWWMPNERFLVCRLA